MPIPPLTMMLRYGGIEMQKSYIVRLTDDDRPALVQLTQSGKAAAAKSQQAHRLLAVEANGPNGSAEPVATALHGHAKTARNGRQRFVEQGLAAALVRKKQASPRASVALMGPKTRA
jgi:hypothetical protein